MWTEKQAMASVLAQGLAYPLAHKIGYQNGSANHLALGQHAVHVIGQVNAGDRHIGRF